MVRSKQQTQAQEANYENVVRDTLSVSAGKSKEIVSSLAASAGLKEKKASKVAAKVLKKLCAKGVVEKNNNGSFQIVDPSAGKKKKFSKKTKKVCTRRRKKAKKSCKKTKKRRRKSCKKARKPKRKTTRRRRKPKKRVCKPKKKTVVRKRSCKRRRR